MLSINLLMCLGINKDIFYNIIQVFSSLNKVVLQLPLILVGFTQPSKQFLPFYLQKVDFIVSLDTEIKRL